MHRTRGFTLVELMVSITLGLLLLSGLMTVFMASNRAQAELKSASDSTGNGSYAMRMLADDLSAAGFYGQFWALPEPGGALPDPCDVTLAALEAGLAFPVQGYNNPVSSPVSCLGNNDYVPGTDVVVVRRAESAPLAPADVPVTNEVYLQGLAQVASVQFGAGTVPVGTTKNATGATSTLFRKDGLTAAEIRKYVVNIYFIAPCSTPADGSTSCTGAADDGGNPVPTLKRLELTAVSGATTFRIVPLVEGIQALQFDYGVDSAPAALNGFTGLPGDGSPDAYVAAPLLAEWPSVVSVRVSLISRSLSRSPGYTDAKTYDLGTAGTVGPFNDAFRRHLFTSAVRLANISGRREIPQ